MSDKQGNVPQFSDYEKELLLDGGWQCSFCERVNANYVGSCACGHNKKDSDLNRLGLYEEYVEKTGQKLETPAAQMASAEEAKEDAASVETTVSQPAQPEPEAPKPVKNKYIYEDTELGEYEQELSVDFAVVSTHIILPHVPVVTTKTIVISSILVNMWIRKTNIMRMTSTMRKRMKLQQQKLQLHSR